MAHLSLYRKYRSQTFAEVIGQDHVTRTLTNAIVEDRVSHAYLFSGPRGTGKTSTARILAKALNCENPKDGEPDNLCASCKEITGGTSLDVIEYDAASHGSVEDARDLRERVAYAPVSGRRKVYILDECHMLSPAANNALLKVLEEPPEHVVFVFATTEPHKVLQTLLDRCQRYEFRAIDTTDLANHIANVCESEGISIDEDAIAVVANRAAGSARDALSLLDQLVSFSGPKISIEEVGKLLGSTPADLLYEAVDLISERDAGAVLAFADRLIRSGRDVREFVRNLVEHLRALFLTQHATAVQEILDVPDEELEQLMAQANRFGEGELLRLMDLANEIQLSLRQAIEGRLALEVGMARMARPDLHSTPASLLSRIERLERRAGIEDGEPNDVAEDPPVATKPDVKSRKPSAREPSKPESQTSPEDVAREDEGPRTRSTPKAEPISDGDLDIEKIRRGWEVVLNKVKSRKISFQALLLPATPVGWGEGELTLEFNSRSRFHRDQVSDPANQGPLVEAIFDTFGVRPRVRCVLGEDGGEAEPGSGDAGGSTMDQSQLRQPKDPVDLVKEGFGAEVVEET